MTASRFEWVLLIALLGGCRPGLASIPPEHDPANPDAPVAEEADASGSLEDSAFVEPLPEGDGGHHHHHHQHGGKQ